MKDIVVLAQAILDNVDWDSEAPGVSCRFCSSHAQSVRDVQTGALRYGYLQHYEDCVVLLAMRVIDGDA